MTIAKVNGVRKIYSDDEGVEKFGERCGIKVVKTWELPLPEVEAQLTFLEELEQATSSPVALLTGQSIESENKDEKATAEGNGKVEPLAGVPALSESSAAVSLSPEEGSRERGSEAGEGQASRSPLAGEVAE